MKERPILMTPENAQKCHEGTKTQTRRIVKPQPPEDVGKILGPEMYAPAKVDKFGEEYPGEDVFGVYSDDGEWGAVFPYGQVGDRLWVREALAPCHECPCEIYRGQGVKNCPWCDESTSGLKWTPAIHMPRWACRTVLEITEIRVERLQGISEEDAIAEGVVCLGGVNGTYDRDDFSGCWINYSSSEPAAYWNSPIDSYHSLWESIHGVGSWAQNPWVWVIAFRKVTND